MPKKNMTPEERKAWGEKMKAARAAKATEAQPNETVEEVLQESSQSDLLRQVEELKNNPLIQLLLQQQAPAASQPSMVGTHEKYVVDPDYYPNPAERLKQEPKLQRFAFPINYELKWEIQTTRYQTIDNIWQQEPRFVVQLERIVMDDDGNPTAKRIILKRLTLHEDPQAAIAIAREHNLAVDESNQRAFLDEMRYLRIRDWLLEFFYKPKYQARTTGFKEEVVDNQLLQVYEVSSTSNEVIPFDQIQKYRN